MKDHITATTDSPAFGRRSLLRGLGAVGAASVALPLASASTMGASTSATELTTANDAIFVTGKNSSYYIVPGRDQNGNKAVAYGSHGSWQFVQDNRLPWFEPEHIAARPNDKGHYDLLYMGYLGGNLVSNGGYEFYNKPRLGAGKKSVPLSSVSALQYAPGADYFLAVGKNGAGQDRVIHGTSGSWSFTPNKYQLNGWGAEMTHFAVREKANPTNKSHYTMLAVGTRVKKGEPQVVTLGGYEFYNKPRFSVGPKVVPNMVSVDDVVAAPNYYVILGRDASGNSIVAHGGHNNWSFTPGKYQPKMDVTSLALSPRLTGKYDLLAVGTSKKGLSTTGGYEFYSKPRFNSGPKAVKL